MNKISGYVCVRNGDVLDYCWREAVNSLLGVCDEVVLCDSDSTDGTRALALMMAVRESKLRVINWPWPDPNGQISWLTDWLNFTREQLSFPVQIQLDADEVLDPNSYTAVRSVAAIGVSAWVTRLNYWRDPRHLAPEGTVCASKVARIGPTQRWMTSDGPAFEEPNIRTDAIDGTEIVIHHYGFLRRNEAFLEKSGVVQRAFFGSTDPRISENEAALGDWRKGDYFEGKPLVPATIPHPPAMIPWLRARGYVV